MPRLAVVGYYERHNLGDDLFTSVIPLCFPSYEVDFLSIDPLLPLPEIEKEKKVTYDAILLGGGDVAVPYFLTRFRRFLPACYSRPVYLFGAGIPYREYACSGVLDMFDFFYVRTMNALTPLSQTYGARYCHFLPDLVFLLPPLPMCIPPKKHMGFFPIGAHLITRPKLREEIYAELRGYMQEYDIVAYASDTSDGLTNSDLPFCQLLEADLGIPTRCVRSAQCIREEIATLSFALCMRFHAHVLCIIQGVPFISRSSTEKVQDLLTQIEDTRDAASLRTYAENARKRLLLMNYETRIQRQERRVRYPTQDYDLFLARIREKILTQCGKDILIDRSFRIEEEIALPLAREICYFCTRMHGSTYEYGTVQNIKEHAWDIPDMIRWILADVHKKALPTCDLTYMHQNTLEGYHRAGWNYVTNRMRIYASDHAPLLCDTFADRTFLWESKNMHEEGILPYTSPWIGFFHHTGNTEFTPYNLTEVVASELFHASLPTCRGLIFLSASLAQWFSDHLPFPRPPFHVLYHPTLLLRPAYRPTFPLELVQVGAWYRNPWSIHLIPHTPKYILDGKEMGNYRMPPDFVIRSEDMHLEHTNRWVHYFYQWLASFVSSAQFTIRTRDFSVSPPTMENRILAKHLAKLIRSVKRISTLSNTEYDALLARKVIFLHLIDASAVNTIIECIASSTPVIVNRLPAVVEYLGKEYPLLYDTLEEVPTLLTEERVHAAHRYLSTMNKDFLHADFFLEELLSILKKVHE